MRRDARILGNPVLGRLRLPGARFDPPVIFIVDPKAKQMRGQPVAPPPLKRHSARGDASGGEGRQQVGLLANAGAVAFFESTLKKSRFQRFRRYCTRSCERRRRRAGRSTSTAPNCRRPPKSPRHCARSDAAASQSRRPQTSALGSRWSWIRGSERASLREGPMAI